jgi:signal recognition particle subunit SEC65
MNNVAVDIGVEKPTREEVEEVLKELGMLFIVKYI